MFLTVVDLFTNFYEVCFQTDLKEYEALKTSLVTVFCGMAQTLVPMPVQPPRYSYKVCALFAALVVFLLRDVGDGT